SQFLEPTDDYSAENAAQIDFDDAVRLPGGGSTCDLFKTRWQRRDVFVKRLKEEFRAKPLYLDALDKEFDIGVSLRHPSLPEYREFHRDYIIMDYIDGETLAEMIKREDPWLTKKKNIVTMLGELVDVVDYLHRHNVVHCDIKPDNIMITANNRNLMLIDFDKSYTDALCDTSGHPEKYGLTTDKRGRVAIDFRGIGMLVEKLKSSVAGFKFRGYKQFVKACYRNDINCEDLKEILEGERTTRHDQTPANKLAIIIAAAMIATGLIIGLVGYFADRYDKRQVNQAEEIPTEKLPVEEVGFSTPKAEIIEPTSAQITQSEIPDDAKGKAAALDHRITPEAENIEPTPVPITQTEINDKAKSMAAALDQRIKPSFDKLLTGPDRLNALKNDTTLTGPQLLDSIRRHDDIFDEYITEAVEILHEMFPGLTDREEARIMSYSKAYTGYTRRATPELREYGHEIERRYRAEGRSLP
ncbi:MAG: protein kinase, partial [Muribaculaceae bacterium]|nr:protein kinase [Muribaculaceae bacterium]